MKKNPNPTSNAKTLTAKEVAEILQISDKTLEVWRRTGSQDLPYLKIGRSIRYDANDVQRYLVKQRRSFES